MLNPLNWILIRRTNDFWDMIGMSCECSVNGQLVKYAGGYAENTSSDRDVNQINWEGINLWKSKFSRYWSSLNPWYNISISDYWNDQLDCWYLILSLSFIATFFMPFLWIYNWNNCLLLGKCRKNSRSEATLSFHFIIYF